MFGCKLNSETYGVIVGIFFDLSEPVLLGVSLELESVDGLLSSCCCDSEWIERPSPSLSLETMGFSSACWNHNYTKLNGGRIVVYPVNKYKTSGNNDSPLPLIILTDTWPILFVNLLLTVQK